MARKRKYTDEALKRRYKYWIKKGYSSSEANLLAKGKLVRKKKGNKFVLVKG